MLWQSLRRRRWPALFGLGLGCGLLVALSLPPFGWWPLAWAGFGGLTVLVRGCPWRLRALLGFGVGLGQFVPGLWWVEEFSVPGCVLLMLLSALFITVAVAMVPAGKRYAVAAGLPALLTLAEWLRDRFPLGGFPLGGAVLGQATSPLAPTLRIGGTLLLTAETVVVGVAIAELGTALVGRRRTRQQGWTGAIRCAAACAVGVAMPVAGLLSPSGGGGNLKPLRVALVQGGGPRGTRAVNTDPQIVFDRHLRATAPLTGPVDLVVWPEGVLQSHEPYSGTGDAAEVSALARRLQASVVVGVEQDVGPDHYLNEVATWAPSGEVVASYVKNHRVPFGEYVPWRSVLQHFVNLTDVPLDAIPGHSPAFMATPAAPVGVMISYEVFFDGRARSGVRHGGQVLIVPTNTASYRSSQVPTQELAAARERAWETGRSVLQVTPTGYSAVVDPDGRVRMRTTLGRQQVLEAVVSRRTGRTVYVDIGDLPIAVGAVLVYLALAVLTRTRRFGAVPELVHGDAGRD